MTTPVVADTRPARTPSFLSGLLRRPLGLVSALYLLLLVIVTTGAPWIAPSDPEAQDLGNALSGPSAEHWLGTDRLGRDVLSRLLHGGQITLVSVVEAALVFTLLGVTLGLVAGFLGGWADRLIARLGDLLLALPGIIVLLMVLSVFPGNDLATMIALGVISCPTLLRVVRGQTMGLRQELYVKAARLSGLTGGRIMWRHILPRLAGPIIVQVSLFAATAVLVQAALSFLGLSTPETEGPSWGNMVGSAAEVISRDSWLMVPTGGILVITVLALGLLGDAVRDLTVGRALPVVARPRRRPVAAAAVPESDALLSVRDLTIAFGDTTVVRNVSFEVRAGEAFGIVGESGCGKTVTARSLLGLLADGGHIRSGSAVFDGRNLAGMSEKDFRTIRGSRIGLVAQEPMSGLDPSFRVGSQLVEVIRRHSLLSRRAARARSISLLEMVHLPPEVARRYPHELSGGMAQRVVIALALAGDPDLLIADEPTTALDVTVQVEILGLLRELRAELGMAVILVTHDWGALADLCDRAIVMYAGEVVEQATVDDLYRTPRHPYTRGLLAANPHIAPVADGLPAIPGSVPPPSRWPAGCHFQPRCNLATAECGTGPIPLVAPSPARESRCIHIEELVAP